jgi:hypothetical protein
MATSDTDLLGRDLTAAERALLDAYDGVLALLDGDDLAPSAEAAIKEAAASLWQAANTLALDVERPEL